MISEAGGMSCSIGEPLPCERCQTHMCNETAGIGPIELSNMHARAEIVHLYIVLHDGQKWAGEHIGRLSGIEQLYVKAPTPGR